MFQTASVNAAFDCFGSIGISPVAYPANYSFWPRVSFESPPASGHMYLWAGAIWIGGIVGSDTIVSAGFTNWDVRQEMYPTGYASSNRIGTISPFEYPTALSLRAEFDDTVHTGVSYPSDHNMGVFRPLKVAIANRAHSFNGTGADRCIIYDVVATNIGAQTIAQGYFGVYLDADVYCSLSGLSGYDDDLAGSIRGKGVAYIVDNDGDPQNNAYNERSPRKALALKFLNSSFQPVDTNFNWWVRDLLGRGDFGPRQNAYPRDFGTGGTGSPLGNGNEYYVMSTPEWDYDQVMTASIKPDDPVWAFPNPQTSYATHRGGDTRFVLSIGPFNLPPDSAIRVQFAVFTTDSVHNDPLILDFIDFAPELYPLTLDMGAVERTADIADSLANLLTRPDLPPTGLRAVSLSGDSAVVAWDPLVFSDIDSFEIYLSSIPDTAFRHGRVIPPWFRPSEFQKVAKCGQGAHECLLTGLTPGRAYACNAATLTDDLPGAPSIPTLFRMPDPRLSVQIDDTMVLAVDGSRPVIRWHDGGAHMTEHFNIYRFSDTAVARDRYGPFYSRQRLEIAPADSVVVDSTTYFYYAMPPYVQVPGDVFEYEDPSWADGNVYVVAAVDSSGTEYPMSSQVVVYRVPPRTKDIFVLTSSGGRINFVLSSTLKDFYASMLQGYDFGIYSYVDSVAAGCGLNIEQCLDWRDFMAYRMIIIDDGLKDALYSSRFETRTDGFRKYLETGGTILYCGSFSSVEEHRFDVLTAPNWYGLPNPIVTDFFGVDSVYYTGAFYFKSNATLPYEDTLFGFVRAEPAAAGAPELLYDQSGSAFSVDMEAYWPVATAPSVSTFRLDQRGEVTHRYRSSSPSTSVNEGQPVGVMTQLDQGQTYLFGFHLWYMRRDGARQLVDWIMNRIPTGMTHDTSATLPSQFMLSQNYPNPFNPSTTITYAVPRKSDVRLEIFNILGQNVRTLVQENKSAGNYRVSWDGRGNQGRALSTGVYLYRLTAGESVLTRKMLLLK